MLVLITETIIRKEDSILETNLKNSKQCGNCCGVGHYKEFCGAVKTKNSKMSEYHPFHSDLPQNVLYRQYLSSNSPSYSETSSLGTLHDTDADLDSSTHQLPSKFSDNGPNVDHQEIQTEDWTENDPSSTNDSSQLFVLRHEPYGLAQAPARFILDSGSSMRIENLEFANMVIQGLQTINDSPQMFGPSLQEVLSQLMRVRRIVLCLFFQLLRVVYFFLKLLLGRTLRPSQITDAIANQVNTMMVGY